MMTLLGMYVTCRSPRWRFILTRIDSARTLPGSAASAASRSAKAACAEGDGTTSLEAVAAAAQDLEHIFTLKFFAACRISTTGAPESSCRHERVEPPLMSQASARELHVK